MAKKKTAKSKRGQKTCPGCGKVMGARTRECECGHVFRPKQSSKARTPLDYSLEELGALMNAKKALAKPLGKLIEEHGGDVVLAEVKRLME